MNIFEQASRTKLRFPSLKGLLTVEDVWDLPLTSKNGVSIDALGTATMRELKALGEESFLTTKPNLARSEHELRLAVLKYIADVRQAENNARLQAAERAMERQKLLDIIGRKKDEALESLSLEELQKRAAELGG